MKRIGIAMFPFVFPLACLIGCQGLIDGMMAHTGQVAVPETIQPAPTPDNPTPIPAPPIGGNAYDWAFWVGTVLVGSAAVIWDRRYFHNKKANGTG